MLPHPPYQQGIGKAVEGTLCMPRPGGVRKGWRIINLVVSDFVLSCHEIVEGKRKPGLVEPGALFVLDLRCVAGLLACVRVSSSS